MASKCVNCGREREAHGEDGRCPKGFSGTWKAYDDTNVREMPQQPIGVEAEPPESNPAPCLACGKPEADHGGMFSHRYRPESKPEPDEPAPPAPDPDLCAKCGQGIDAHTEGGYCKAKGLPKGSRFTPGGNPLAIDDKVQTSALEGKPQILITFDRDQQAVNVEYRNFKNIEFILSTIEQARIVMEQHRQSLAAQATMQQLAAQASPPGGMDLNALRRGRPS